MAIDDRPLQENRTIIVLPWEIDSPEWIMDKDGKLLPVTSTAQWFEVIKPQVKVSGLVGMDGEEREEETLEFHSINDFKPKMIQEQSEILKDIVTYKMESKRIAEKLYKSKKLRQILGE